MNQCFGGGDQGHKQEVQQRKNAIKRCANICGRQCGPRPDINPVPARVPSRHPSAPPVPSLPNAVPVTVTGAALLILYIITSALQPGPI